jgi:LacI family transcriptional regulator
MAGVSIKSVSRVINHEPNVRESMRAKVQAAIDALGFRPNVAARSLAAGRSFLIGILFDNPSPNYTMQAQDGVYAVCREHGYQLTIERVDCQSDNVAADMEAMLLHHRLDGMVVTPPATESDAVLSVLERLKIPYVRIAPVSYPGRSDAVDMDDRAAAAEVAAHLCALGHTEFGIINGPANHGAAALRRQGFLDALADHGIAGARVYQAQGDFTYLSGMRAGFEILRQARRPTAVFAENDDMAAGFYAAVAQAGLKIPDDISVVGFDDSWIAEALWPALTTIHQPTAAMAGLAATRLIDGGWSGSRTLPYHLALRGSTGIYAGDGS